MIDSIKGFSVPNMTQGVDSQIAGPGAVKTDAKDSFSSTLKESIDNVSKLSNEADNAIKGLASGEHTNIHDTMIAIEKANLSFNMMVQVRNKLLAAYEEVMRMQV